MKRAFARMKSRWGVGPLGVVAILLVFSLTGSSVVLLRRPIMGFLLPADAATWLQVVLYLLVIFPLYQVLLLVYGALFGQFRFFWKKEKQLLLLFRRLLGRRPAG
jgi:hypothetical protein